VQAHKLAALSAIVLYASAAGPSARDIDGRQIDVISKGISVLLFTRADCPISNRYAPEITRLYQRFHSAGVVFRVVYVDPKQSADTARAHLREYNYPFAAILDKQHDVVKFAGAKATPEVAVFDGERLVYRGRIDNKYVSAGTSRPHATIHDLEETLVGATKGQPLKFRTEPAVGCFIEDLR
jgi:AhpC/TSA family